MRLADCRRVYVCVYHSHLFVLCQAEPCIRDEEPDIEGYSILSSMVSDLTGDLLSYAVRLVLEMGRICTK